MKNTPPHLVRSGKQLAALAAAARQEIVDVLEQMDTVSVAALAAALGRPADALYFHLRALTRAGLVQSAGRRSRGGRNEAIYRTVAPELQLQYEPENPANREAISAIVPSMLRLASPAMLWFAALAANSGHCARWGGFRTPNWAQ